MNTFSLVCPACGTQTITGYDLGIRPEYPQICLQCRALVVLDVSGDEPVLRYPTEDEEKWMLTAPMVLNAVKLVADYHRREGPPMSHPADGDPT